MDPDRKPITKEVDGAWAMLNTHLQSFSCPVHSRLVTTSTASYVYDANGNLISKTDSSGMTQYSWDFENRLKQVTLPNGNTVTYKYDALGRRIQRAPSTGISTNFIYDGQDVVKDLNSDGSTVDYLNGPGIDNKLRFADSRLAATGPLYFLQDHLGSTTALTNSLGNIAGQVNYDGFGNSTGSSLTRYDYTGRERDPDTGLLYYRARFYDPQVGRFISEDPITFQGGTNSYSYVKNNPLRLKDPMGLEPWDTWDFVRHYYLGFGTTVDLANVGLLERFQRSSSVTAATTAFKQEILQKAKGEARAQCARSAVTKKNSGSSFPVPATSVVIDVTSEPNLYAVGHSSFFRTAVCFVYPNCPCRTFRFSCTLGFYIADWFQDPVNLRIEPLGIPYRINASWSEEFSGNSNF